MMMIDEIATSLQVHQWKNYLVTFVIVIAKTGRWWVGCYICYSDEGPGRGRSPPRSLIAVPNVTAHPPTASAPTSYSYYQCPLKGKTVRFIAPTLATTPVLGPAMPTNSNVYSLVYVHGSLDAQTNGRDTVDWWWWARTFYVVLITITSRTSESISIRLPS